MKLTNMQVQEVLAGIRALGSEKMPAKLAWKLQTARKSLEPFLETLTASIQEIQQKYATRDEKGELLPAKDAEGNPIPGTIAIPEEKIGPANKDLEELLSQKVEVTNVSLSIADFPDTLTVTADAMAALSPIITD
jgi:hypothetical protein